MGRRVFSREFKLEAVKQIIDRGVPAVQVARDIEVHLTLVNRWVREHREDTAQAFPGRGQMRPAEADVVRLQRELRRVTAERDILKKALGYFAKDAT